MDDLIKYMMETELLIGMKKYQIRNTDYSREAMDEFLHGSKNSCADEVKKDQLKWPETTTQDIHYTWPSQVFFYPSLAVVENIYFINSKQGSHNNPVFQKIILNNTNFLNQIKHTNINSMKQLNCEVSSAPGIIKSFGRLKVDTEEVTALSVKSSNRNTINSLKIESEQINDTLNKTTAHKIIKAISLTCAEDGERIARIHCYRPFFKKIDGLCVRIKQDLIRDDTVIPHVNAQGIVWAIKDLVFVCTRIINAWNITKGYVYDPSEGLNKVRSTLTSEFVRSFVAWQETSFRFIESLMMSFLNLDILAHTSNNSVKRLEFRKKLDNFMKNLIKQTKTCSSNSKVNNKFWKQCGCEPCKIVISSESAHNALMELSLSCSEYGEKVAKNYMSRSFFKKIDSLCNRTKLDLINADGALCNLNSQGTVWAIKELIFASTRIINAWNISKMYVYGSSEGLEKVRVGLSIDFVPSFVAWQETTSDFIENLRMSFLRLNNLAQTESNNFKKESISKSIKVFKDHLKQLKSAEVFFRSIFCRNYFPDFIAKTPDFKDVRSVIEKCQSGGYRHINEVVHDVRYIIYQVKKYLMRNIEPNLDRALNNFQADVNKILAQKSFKDYHFDHIEGRPNEIIFIYK